MSQKIPALEQVIGLTLLGLMEAMTMTMTMASSFSWWRVDEAGWWLLASR